MKQTFLIAMLALLSMNGRLHAQCGTNNSISRSDMVFNLSKWFTTNRHIAYLKNGNKMTVELYYLKDYYLIGNMDSLVRNVMEDLAFYKDSMEAAGANSLRIDYAITRDNKFKKMRFRTHSNGETTFVKNNGGLSSLKLEQDTIRIKIANEEPDDNYPDCISKIEQLRITQQTHPVQITFVLNSYDDIYELAKGNELNRIVDTFKMRSSADKPFRENSNNVTTIFYSPYSTEPKNLTMKYMMIDDKGESQMNKTLKQDQSLQVVFGVGASLVRNTIAPMMNFGIEYQKRWIGTKREFKSYGLYASPYYFFNKGTDGRYNTHISWFINAEKTNTYSKASDSKFSERGGGIGYLLNPDGYIFQKQTVKAYFNFTFIGGISVCPELIVTNNFRNFIPGVTLRLFHMH